MKVRSEVHKNGESLAVELSAEDGRQQFGAEAWDTWTLSARVQALQKHADKLVVVWMARNELVSKEWAVARIKELS